MGAGLGITQTGMTALETGVASAASGYVSNLTMGCLDLGVRGLEKSIFASPPSKPRPPKFSTINAFRALELGSFALLD